MKFEHSLPFTINKKLGKNLSFGDFLKEKNIKPITIISYPQKKFGNKDGGPENSKTGLKIHLG